MILEVAGKSRPNKMTETVELLLPASAAEQIRWWLMSPD
jgi:hypothetical protein